MTATQTTSKNKGRFDGILLMSDLDGTLLNRNKQIPARNLEAIRRFQQGGGLFSIATGRCPRSAEQVAQHAEVNCPGVTLNGAAVYDFATQRIVSSRMLPLSYKEMVASVHKAFPDIGIQAYIGSDITMVVSSEVVEKLLVIENLPCRKTDLLHLPDDVNKILFGAPHARLRELQAFLQNDHLSGMYGMFTEICYFEILPSHTNKGVGVRAVAEYCGIQPENVVAVGDYYNDIDMLKAVANPVVAGNAPDDVKIFARHVTGDCDHGVIADTIDYIEQQLTEYGRLGRFTACDPPRG